MRASCIRAFGSWVTTFSWDALFTLDSCKDKFDFFIQTLSAAFDRYLPTKVSRMHRTDKAWLTPKIKACIAKRKKALPHFGKDSPSLKMWRNKVQALIKTCKRQFYERKVISLKHPNVSRWWKKVKNISGVSAKDDMWYNQLLDPNIADPFGTLCEKINDFFVGLTMFRAASVVQRSDLVSSGFIPNDSNHFESLFRCFCTIFRGFSADFNFI